MAAKLNKLDSNNGEMVGVVVVPPSLSDADAPSNLARKGTIVAHKSPTTKADAIAGETPCETDYQPPKGSITMTDAPTIEELRLDVEAKREALADAFADGHLVRAERARKSLEVAQRALDDAQLFARGLAKREAQAKAERIAADTAARRAQIATLAAERGQLAEEIEALTEQIGPKFARLNDLHREILNSVSGRIDTDRATLTRLSDRLLETLWRAGLVTGSPFSQWELDRRPTLSAQIFEGNSYLRSL